MKSLTDEYFLIWDHLAVSYKIQRLLDWANMLEKRVQEFDPSYRAFPFGRQEKK